MHIYAADTRELTEKLAYLRALLAFWLVFGQLLIYDKANLVAYSIQLMSVILSLY